VPRVNFALLENNSRLLPLFVRTVPLVNFKIKTQQRVPPVNFVITVRILSLKTNNVHHATWASTKTKINKPRQRVPFVPQALRSMAQKILVNHVPLASTKKKTHWRVLRVNIARRDTNSQRLPLFVRTVPPVNFNTKTTNLRRPVKRVAPVNTVRRCLWCAKIVKRASTKKQTKIWRIHASFAPKEKNSVPLLPFVPIAPLEGFKNKTRQLPSLANNAWPVPNGPAPPQFAMLAPLASTKNRTMLIQQIVNFVKRVKNSPPRPLLVQFVWRASTKIKSVQQQPRARTVQMVATSLILQRPKKNTMLKAIVNFVKRAKNSLPKPSLVRCVWRASTKNKTPNLRPPANHVQPVNTRQRRPPCAKRAPTASTKTP